jgi:hypothetical protein
VWRCIHHGSTEDTENGNREQQKTGVVLRAFRASVVNHDEAPPRRRL